MRARRRRGGLAGIGHVEPGKQVQQRRLPGAGRAGDGVEPAAGEGGGELVERHRRAEAASEAARFEESLFWSNTKSAGNGFGGRLRASLCWIHTRSSPAVAATTRRSSSRLTVARSEIPAERRALSGRRSQPPRPTTTASSPPPATSRSSLTRPSRTWTTRSACSTVAGSWLTRSAVAPCSRTSSATSASTPLAVFASSSPVGSSATRRRGR